MSKKTLNKENLQKLGSETLAGLVMDLVQGSATLQRRARMELSAAQGPKDVAADIRKRFASLRRSTSYIDWRQQRALVKDLDGLLGAIESNIAAVDASEAFELLWSFLQLAPSIYERTDDSNGAVGGVMAEAVDLIAAIAPRLSPDPETLAERILEAVAEAGYGEFDGIIPATAEALGTDGLDHLKQITEAWAAQPPITQDLDRYAGYGFSSSPEEIAYRQKQGTRSIILADIADAQGDVDAYMARYSEEQLTYATIAPGVARRLLDAGRIEDALAIIERAKTAESAKSFRMSGDDLNKVYEECLEKLGKVVALKDHLWNAFRQNLSKRSLRKYLKLLPDFEDIDAERTALDFAETFPFIELAISFLIEWPAHERAAKVVLTRANDLDGNSYHILTTGAAALEPQYPLAATMMRRIMVQDTLDGGKSKRYRYAARHLAECQSCDASIDDYGDFPTHETFVQALKQKHGRKYGFWELVDE
ncbi:hypothetical protein E4191_19325 (plasmid) [Paracoccus liaowanqingii]|uniref:Uncharacterized protein n=1 Tax=Paracoccus liaowanqingii TaxID=2560053 RepID=A0A4Y5SU47_9RHOB|nr:DUF6880 family protein [Paracoccus liaowanqingii]QDA36266.1 hypothetical protein E4191_19325 [Paracoccus liaowanqingii]